MKPGPLPAVRRRVNPELHRAVRRSGRPGWLLAVLAGFPHQSALTASLRAVEVSATPIVVKRLERVAKEIGFPADEIFTDAPEVVR